MAGATGTLDSRSLLTVRNPARYIGGEYGSIIKADSDVDLTCVTAFPDLYEIAMSNQAVKLLYQGMNDLARVRC